MQLDEEIQDARESGLPEQKEQPAHDVQPERPIALDPTRKLGHGLIIAVIVVAVLIGVLVAAGIHSRARAEETLVENTQQSSILSVAVTTPRGGAGPLEITLPANTEAYIDTPIYARTSGYLRRWYADIGTRVHRGEVLADIETPELDQQVQAAQADLATAQANLQIAQITAERWKKLLAKNAVSRQEADQATSDYSARQSALSSAQANVRRLQQLQGYEKVYAPFDGVITARNVDIGSLIQAGDSNSPNAELFHMDSIGKLRLFVPVPEVYASTVHNGERIEVTSDAAPNQKFFGTIVRDADAINISTRTLNVEVDVPNPEHKLLPGQYAFVHLPLPPSRASMTLPSNVLLFRSEGLRVGVVRNGHVQLVPVQIGHDYGATVEITSGLTPQDQVILNPSDSLAQGEPVQIEKGDGV
ncbi:MAG: efflux RND transporter periplasmic adaptor subunit [Acidobacteriaceae bacterium]